MLEKKGIFLRGSRIAAELELVETTLGQLQQKTNLVQPQPSTGRQNATGPIQVKSVVLVPMRSQRDSGQIKVEAKVQSGPTTYDSTILFFDVIFEDQDRPDNITFTGSDKQEYHVSPILLSRNNAEVRCTCLDFYFTFSAWNKNDRSLYGDPAEPYVRKTVDRAERNPTHMSGMCKHLLRLMQELRNERLVR